MAKLKITQTNSTTGDVVDAFVSPTLINGSHFGGTGGNTSITGQQIQPTVFITGGSQKTGNIIAQKGAHKFRVYDGTLIGTCTLANTSTLAAGQMNIQINLASIVSANLIAANVVSGATSTYVTYATANIATPLGAPIVGHQIVGFTGNAATSFVTAINPTVAGLANITVSVTGNVAAQTATVTESAYASRITNKFVYEFDGDKYRYHLTTPDTTFVQVTSA
ncbi:MAG TPA: hypothetical protein VFM18_19190 [Methanosarcina sp.]|nr:hypothetical protein [Methanosarcina sp.]